jgi:hypothetical protein
MAHLKVWYRFVAWSPSQLVTWPKRAMFNGSAAGAACTGIVRMVQATARTQEAQTQAKLLLIMRVP